MFVNDTKQTNQNTSTEAKLDVYCKAIYYLTQNSQFHFASVFLTQRSNSALLVQSGALLFT